MANLVIDIGNTLTKVAVFEHEQLLETGHYADADTALFDDLLSRYTIDKAIISSVKKDTPYWLSVLSTRLTVMHFTATMASGITNHYLTPHTLGLDRVAAVNGAVHLYPQKNSLVIDGGTTITYDWVDAGANYFGGSISPGLNTRYKALNHYTQGLPLVDADAGFGMAYGNSTQTAIQSGVQNGLKYELAGFIEAYSQTDKQLNIILTGGDSDFFDTLLKNSIFAPQINIEPNLVLIGLNAALLQHND
ncbi:type III pantothenate kinase [Mucilaginibacter sp. JRF]|uniref:type III pantothenate kinase n=1 Tax=Mucilaginibacter sp. JRF TaxID=2780088 RepID=UPI0018802621|nr:type III pantothenate kinase [Mucilaginibacter sp. JRF]MBE9585410.1 type III pantothenate kinase [Mucilaginibacter sp. JRF]